MTLLQRYLFRQLTVSTFLSVGLFVVVLLIGNAIKDVIELLAKGFLSWSTFLDVMLKLLPSVIAYALPLGLLTGTLLTLGRLSAQSEIVAMRAVGVSHWHLSLPIFLIGTLGTLFAAVVNLHYAPNAIRSYRESLANLARNNPTRFLLPHVFIDRFPGYIFYIQGDREGQTLQNFYIWELGEHQEIDIFLKAEKASFTHDKSKNAILLTLWNGCAQKYTHGDGCNVSQSPVTTLSFQQSSIHLPLDQIFGSSMGQRKLSHANIFELLQMRQEAAKNPLKEQGSKDFIRIQLEIQKNLAMAFSVFSLTLLAIPLGIRFSRSETFFNIAVAVALGLAYYFLVIAFSWLDSKPYLRPDFLVWIPNLLFFSLGSFLFFRCARH